MAKTTGGSRSGPKAGSAYVPETGDVIWLTFTPQAGREQAGRRPGLVLSPSAYNRKTSLCLVCPITSKIKGFPFEVILPQECTLQGVILTDHVRSADWQARKAVYVETVSDQILDEVRAKLQALIGG